MSESLDKQVNAQKENLKKYFRGLHKLPQAYEKCAMKIKEQTKKRHTYKSVIHGRKPFIMPIPKPDENDLYELQVNDSEYTKVLFI